MHMYVYIYICVHTAFTAAKLVPCGSHRHFSLFTSSLDHKLPDSLGSRVIVSPKSQESEPQIIHPLLDCDSLWTRGNPHL